MAPRRNKPICTFDGWAMRLKKCRKDGIELYYCTERDRRARCDALYEFDPSSEKFAVVKPHVRHELDVTYSDSQLARQDLKNLANSGTPREVIDMVRNRYSAAATVALGSYEAKRKVIYHARGSKEEATGVMDRGGPISKEFEKTLDGKPFLVKDVFIQTSDGQSRLLVFASEIGLRILEKSTVVLCDGTFDCVPKDYCQLFSIHAYLTDSVIRPVAYALLPDKNTSSYEIVLEVLRTRVPKWEPEVLLCDFEFALKNSFQHSFPQIQVQGCLFHLLQSWRRQAEKKKLYDQFTIGNLHLFWKRLKALPFISSDSIEDFFDHLVEQSVAFPLITQNLSDYFEYIKNNYVKQGARYPADMWCCVNRTEAGIHRTTNVVECWHKTMSAVSSDKRGLGQVMMSDILRKIRSEENHTMIDFSELQVNPNFRVNKSRTCTNILKDRTLLKVLINSPNPPDVPLYGVDLLDAISLASKSS